MTFHESKKFTSNFVRETSEAADDRFAYRLVEAAQRIAPPVLRLTRLLSPRSEKFKGQPASSDFAGKTKVKLETVCALLTHRVAI